MSLTDSNKGSTIMRATEHLVFEPLIETLVERGSVGMIVAPAKAKKSMLALNLDFSLLTKKDFLGLKVSPGAKVEKIVYINLELTKTALGVRMRAMNKYYQATGKQLDNVIFLTAHEFTNDQPLVDTKTQEVNAKPFNRLAEAAKKWGATVLIIDPLYYVVDRGQACFGNGRRTGHAKRVRPPLGGARRKGGRPTLLAETLCVSCLLVSKPSAASASLTT